MREILFRGQTRRYGEKVMMGDGTKLPSQWVYGGIFPQNKGGCYSIIYTYDPIEKRAVYADTVGQYTGLIDRNGVKIFEGDILLIGNGAEPVLVEFVDFSWACTSKAIGPYYRHRLENNSQKYEVIGNIHDTPELLKQSEDIQDGD